MKITIDDKSGFCFGVVGAIEKAEQLLANGEKIYCLGDIVHNQMEVKRLEDLGLITINHELFFQLKDCKVLLRAHGEPPSTYEYARANNIELIDGTCPVVLHLQRKVREGYDDIQQKEGQIVLLGKVDHAEVKGLNGQTDNHAIVIENDADIELLDPTKPTIVFAQTTKSLDDFHRLKERIEQHVHNAVTVKDTICRQVSHRMPSVAEFAQQHDVIIFVSGKKSSNGKALFENCRKVNPRTHFVSQLSDVRKEWFEDCQSVGITGATSTPQWQMKEVARAIQSPLLTQQPPPNLPRGGGVRTTKIDK
ncbi:MAG: 4-hydroxy-3-methylbut-2-enyl diphosphate reductase [Mangrovibacterium sp.]